MSIREMRLQTKLSQSKFAAMFDIPVSTLRDWEQGRRTPPAYVLKMIKTILHENGLLNDNSYIEACELRKKNVESALAVLFSATNGPDAAFMEMSRQSVMLFALTYVTRWFSFATQSYVVAVEKAKEATLISVSTALIFPVVLIVVLWPLGLTGIWLNFAGTSVLAGIMSFVILKKSSVRSAS